MALVVPTKEECADLWNRLDYNGNGMLSLAELDKGVSELWPDLNNKPAIMRAYKAADMNDDGFIRPSEFRFFLSYIQLYNDLWKQFAEMDQDGDRRLDQEEFAKVAQLAGVENPDQVFAEMDVNKGGYVLFDEFCAYMVKKNE